MACPSILSKINCNDRKFFLLLSYQHGGVGINLKLSDGVKVWSGKINEKELISWSEKTKLTLPDYKSQTIKALGGESLDGREFEYDVKVECDGSLSLIWKRVLEDADIKFQLGYVILQPELNLVDSLCHILEASVELTQGLQSRIQSLTEERDKLTSERVVALQRLEQYVSVKEDTERDLYSKFVVVLNDKKAKIRELKEQLDQVQSRPVTQLPVTDIRKNHATIGEEDNQPTTSRTQSSDSDIEYNTDNEMKDNSLAVRKNRGNFAMKKKEEQEKKDAGLMLDDGIDNDDDEETIALPKRIRKGKSEMAKRVPSATLIPHVESSEIHPGSSRKRSLQKTSSKGSSHNLDVSNLIDDMD